MLVKTLPAEFHDVSYCYQLSSPAGITGPGFRIEKQVDANREAHMVEKNFNYPGWCKISAHVLFWLTRKHRNLAQWAKNLNATRGKKVIDPAFLETVQPNYCACPRFIGMANPVPADQRSGLVQKAADAVELVGIDAPIRYVEINNTAHKVGAHVQKVGKTYLATPSLQDRLAMIGQGGSYREPLKSCLGYYYWLKGCTADPDEITGLIRNAPINWAGRDYMGQHLDDLVSWFAARNTHEPISRRTPDDALQARLIEWRPGAPKLPDTLLDDLDDWVFDLEESGLEYNFIEGECGEGKTEWLIDRVVTKPRRYLVSLPRIDMIREVSARLMEKHPAIEQTHLVHTIFTDKENDIRDEEDEEDAFAASGTTVTYQIQKFRERIGTKRAVVLFITHAAMLAADWYSWRDFEMIVDEIPEPYVTQCRDFRNTADYVWQFIEATDSSETNYHHLGLTDAGWRKTGVNGSFDDNEQPLRSLLEAIRRPNVSVYAHKEGWDQMAAQKVLLMRLLHAGFARYFRAVTIIGDEFRRSTLALAFTCKYGVDWQPHPDWKPARTRTTPLKDRVRLFYFASREELRGSLTGYEDRKLIPKLIKWFEVNNPGQVLITTNKRFKHLFEMPDFGVEDDAHVDGIYRTRKGKKISLLWVPPKLAGTDLYKTMTNVAFLAAMRPGRDEVALVRKSLLISEDEIIRWREYNTLYQFVMRICLRLFDSDQIANIYVFDEYQAEYLRERFGGCLDDTHIKDAIPTAKPSKGGRPKKPEGDAMSAAERKRRQRHKAKAA